MAHTITKPQQAIPCVATRGEWGQERKELTNSRAPASDFFRIFELVTAANRKNWPRKKIHLARRGTPFVVCSLPLWSSSLCSVWLCSFLSLLPLRSPLNLQSSSTYFPQNDWVLFFLAMFCLFLCLTFLACSYSVICYFYCIHHNMNSSFFDYMFFPHSLSLHSPLATTLLPTNAAPMLLVTFKMMRPRGRGIKSMVHPVWSTHGISPLIALRMIFWWLLHHLAVWWMYWCWRAKAKRSSRCRTSSLHPLSWSSIPLTHAW